MKKRFCLRPFSVASLTLAALFPARSASGVFPCLVSHTRPDIHTPTEMAEREPSHPARLRGVPVQTSPAAVSQIATLCWVGEAVVGEPEANRGGGRVQGDGRIGGAVWSIHPGLCLHPTHERRGPGSTQDDTTGKRIHQPHYIYLHGANIV